MRRHVVAELESPPNVAVHPAAASGSTGVGEVSGALEAHMLAQGETVWRLEVTPRSTEGLVESLCNETSRFLAPFGEDLETLSLGTRLSGGECFRRLLRFRFEVEYISLPLGAKKLQAFALAACERERTAPEPRNGWTAEDLAEALQRASDAHIWLRLLLTRTGDTAVAVEWSKQAEHFTLFLQTAMKERPVLAGAVGQLRLGQLCVLAAWWAYVKCTKAASRR